MLRNVGDGQVCTLSRAVSNLCNVESCSNVSYGNVVNVILMLMECSSNFRGVTVRTVNTVMPVAEISRCRVEVRRLQVFVLSHVSQLLSVILELFMVRALTICAVTPRIKNEFREGMVRNSRFELAGTVTGVIVHFGQVLDELGFRFGVAAPPIFIGHAISVVVFPVDVVFVDLSVAVVICIVDRPVIHVVILTCITCTRDQWASSTQRCTPLELVVSI